MAKKTTNENKPANRDEVPPLPAEAGVVQAVSVAAPGETAASNASEQSVPADAEKQSQADDIVVAGEPDEADLDGSIIAKLDTDALGEFDVEIDADPVHSVIIELPMAEKAFGYEQRHMTRPLPAPIAETYKRLAQGLSSVGAKLDDGRPVETVEHAIIFVGQQLRAQPVGV